LAGQDPLKFSVALGSDPNADPQGGAVPLGHEKVFGVSQEQSLHVRHDFVAASELNPVRRP
jgi:hypothetical protein